MSAEGDWKRYEQRQPLPHDVKEGTAGPYFYGSSLDFLDFIRHERPELRVPEGSIVPLDGQIGWDPSFEDPSAAKCPRCLTAIAIRKGPILVEPLALFRIAVPDFDPKTGALSPAPDRHPIGCPYCRERIDYGSQIFCPKCGMSGHERQLRKQRELAGMPPPEPPEKPPKPEKTGAPPKSRRERRQSQHAKAKPD